MAINKKLIHFKTKAVFNEKLANNEILDTSIVFIQDSRQIWTHGQLYNCHDQDLSKYLTESDLKEINDSISNINTTLASKADTSTLTTDYAKKTDVPTRESQLIADRGYITSTAADGKYATVANVNNLQKEIDDLETNVANNYVTNTVLTTELGKKQNTISDLSTIRSNAALGATALQEGDLDDINDSISTLQTDVNSLKTNKLDVSTASNTYATKSSLSGYVPTTRKVNGVALDKDVTITATDPNAVTKAEFNEYKTTVNNTLTGYATDSELSSGLSKKQDVISDLATIRSGAAAGATALQESDLDEINESISDLETLIANKADSSSLSSYAKKTDLNGYVPTTRTVNGKALSANISLSAGDVGAPTTNAFNTLNEEVTDLETLVNNKLDTATASDTYATKTALSEGLAAKQATLVSGTNIKTIEGTSILGSGDIQITASQVGAYTKNEIDTKVTTINNSISSVSSQATTNKNAIATLNGAESTTGSVKAIAKSYADTAESNANDYTDEVKTSLQDQITSNDNDITTINNKFSSYATTSALSGVSNRVAAIEGLIATDSDAVIDKWDEVVTFLDGIGTDNDLEALLASKANQSALNATNTTIANLKTDAVAEGSANLYFTNARARSAITGGASTVTSSNLTANRALISNSSGKIAVSDITATELGYLDGVTSNIQSQLDAKAPISLSTTVANLTTSSVAEGTNLYHTASRARNAVFNQTGVLTANRALVSDANGYVAESAVTSTELGYLDGVTSAIQTQLDNKAAKSVETTASTNASNISTLQGYFSSGKAKTAAAADTATTATKLASAPSLSAGTSDTNKITITAGGKTSSEFTVPYATSSGSASTATSAATAATCTGNSATATALTTTSKGSATNPIYWDANGKPVACTYSLNKTVPSNAVFTDTDTKVTSVDNHYTPAENTSAAINAASGTATNITGSSGKLNVITGLKRDAKGHIVGVTSANIYSTDNNTTYTAGNGLTLSGTTLAVGAGTGISVAADTVGLATVSGLTAGTYGPSADVTGTNSTTIKVPEITVDSYGRVTSVTNRTYTSKDTNTTYSITASSKSKTTAATAGWYRIASSIAGINRCIGTFEIEGTISGKHSAATIMAGCNYGVTASSNVTVLNCSHYSSSALTKVRIVYHTTYSGNYAYLEVYNPNASAITINVKLVNGFGWSLVDPNTAGSIPSGYSSKEATLSNGTIYSENFSGSGANLTSLNASNISSGTIGAARLPAATESAQGAMTAAMVTKLKGIADNANNYSLPLAASGTRGGIQLGYTAAGANLPVLVSSEKAYVALTKTAVTTALGYTPPTSDTNTWRPIYNGVDSTATDTSASANAVKTAYDKAVSAYDLANSKTANKGTVTSVATGAGLTGGTITTSGTIKANLKSETKSTLSSTSMGSTSSRQYAVGLDKDGYLSVNIPWTDTTYTLSSLGIGNVKNYDQSKAIKSITRSGTTFTYTCLDGTTGTFTQQDNNTTYSFSNNNPTLAWGTKSTIGTVGGTALTVTMPANPNTDTKYWQEITYASLVSLRNNKNLVPGRFYRITDYVTTVNSNYAGSSAGIQFDIIVQAIGTSTLSEDATACANASDNYFTEYGANVEGWKLKYCLDNDTERFDWADSSGKGVIYRMIDEYNNDCPFDFKNILDANGNFFFSGWGANYEQPADASLQTDGVTTWVVMNNTLQYLTGSTTSAMNLPNSSIYVYGGGNIVRNTFHSMYNCNFDTIEGYMSDNKFEGIIMDTSFAGTIDCCTFGNIYNSTFSATNIQHCRFWIVANTTFNSDSDIKECNIHEVVNSSFTGSSIAGLVVENRIDYIIFNTSGAIKYITFEGANAYLTFEEDVNISGPIFKTAVQGTSSEPLNLSDVLIRSSSGGISSIQTVYRDNGGNVVSRYTAPYSYSSVDDADQVPTTANICYWPVSASSTLAFSGNLYNGMDVHIIVENVSDATVTIALPTEDPFVKTGTISSLLLAAGKCGEINALMINNKVFLRASL